MASASCFVQNKMCHARYALIRSNCAGQPATHKTRRAQHNILDDVWDYNRPDEDLFASPHMLLCLIMYFKSCPVTHNSEIKWRENRGNEVIARPWLSMCPSHVPVVMNYLLRRWAQWVVGGWEGASVTGTVMTVSGLVSKRRSLIGDITRVAEVSDAWHRSAMRAPPPPLHRIQISRRLPNCSLYLPVQRGVSCCKWLAH